MIKASVQGIRARMVVRVSVITSVSVHLFILVLNVRKKDWELRITPRQTHRQFLMPAIVWAVDCTGSNHQVKRSRLKRTVI